MQRSAEEKQTPLGQLVSMAEVEKITKKARKLPPSGDQAHVLLEGCDPWVAAYNGWYYYIATDDLATKKKVLISKFKTLKEFATAPLVEVWPCSNCDANIPAYQEIWAPELQIIDNVPYIYVTLYMGNTKERGGRKERIHCLVGQKGNPQGEYRYRTQVNIKTDRWAIDGTTFLLDNKRYFVWSGWGERVSYSQNLYIAEMENPWTVISDRVLISKPDHDWEMHGYPHINEGPQALQHDGRTFIIYSASGSWTDDYCLGQLTYLGRDPLDPASWRKELGPVFKKTDTIFGVGHCCFIQEDGKDILIYHAARSSGAGWARQVRWKEFSWKPDGSPDFGKPI